MTKNPLFLQSAVPSRRSFQSRSFASLRMTQPQLRIATKIHFVCAPYAIKLRLKMGIASLNPSDIASLVCHSEERGDEESAFSAVGGSRSSVVSKQILRFAQDDTTATPNCHKDPLCLRSLRDKIVLEDGYRFAQPILHSPGLFTLREKTPTASVGWVEALSADTHHALR